MHLMLVFQEIFQIVRAVHEKLAVRTLLLSVESNQNLVIGL